jgi:DVNP family
MVQGRKVRGATSIFVMAKVIKGESYFDQATGLERRRRFGGGFFDGFGGAQIKSCGSKREVWNGSAEKTAGGLTIDKLGKNKRGHIVSVAKYLQGKQRIGQLAQSPYFGRVQDLAPRSGGGRSKNGSPKGASSPRSPRTKQSKTLQPKQPKMVQAGSYMDDISRLGGIGSGTVGFRHPYPGMSQKPSAFPPMVHLPFPHPMPASPYPLSQSPYPLH